MELTKNELILNDLYLNQLSLQKQIKNLKENKIFFLSKKDFLNFEKTKNLLKDLEKKDEILNDKIFKILDSDKEMNDLYHQFKKAFNF